MAKPNVVIMADQQPSTRAARAQGVRRRSDGITGALARG
jgi:hypothetical protein